MSVRFTFLAGFSAIGMLFSVPAQAVTDFSINIRSISGFTTQQEALVELAVDTWESVITGYQHDLNFTNDSDGDIFDGIEVDFAIEAIDGAGDANGNIIAQAGPRFVNLFHNVDGQGSNLAYTTEGRVAFDSNDVGQFGSGQAFLDVIAHELAHVLGFGTLWNPQFTNNNNVYNDVLDANGNYDGAAALGVYQVLDPLATFIPTDGGGGHWAENGTLLGEDALMTPFIDPVMFIHPVTVASFVDLGYTVQVPAVAAVPLPPSLAFVMTGLFGLFAMSRRRAARS